MKMYYVQWRQREGDSFAAADFPRQDILDKLDFPGGPYAVLKTNVDASSLNLAGDVFGEIPAEEQAAVLERVGAPADFAPTSYTAPAEEESE